jgi:ubiquinone biosynthesis protein UbiJ
MANVDHYRQLVQKLLEDYSKVDFNNPDLETELIFDTSALAQPLRRRIATRLSTSAGQTSAESMVAYYTSTSKTAKSGFSTTAPKAASPMNW